MDSRYRDEEEGAAGSEPVGRAVELNTLLSEPDHDEQSQDDDEQDDENSRLGYNDFKTKKRTAWRVLLDGPLQLKEPHVTMIYPKLQNLPRRIKNAMPHPKALFIGSLIVWGLLFYNAASSSILATPSLDGDPVELLSCTGTPWRGKNAKCGTNASHCLQPEGKILKFKCPADCRKESWTYSGTPVGDFESIYRPYVIGSHNTYRSDSYICGAAVHHGSISDRTGGCGAIKFNGQQSSFLSKSQNGIESLAFDSQFPQSFSFLDTSEWSCHGCTDLRWFIIIMNVLFSAVLGYLVSDAGAFFWPQFLVGFWTVLLASNPPIGSGKNVDMVVAELVSLGFRRFLPSLFVAYVIYITAVKPQLNGLEANFSRAILWVGGYWIGILENFVFGALPLDRLTVHDLNAQPGAWLALIILSVTILLIAIGQAFIIWRCGKFKPYILLYLGMGFGLVVLSMIPNQTLRVHHYILALIFLPGTAFKTTPSLFYQGLLVGLFVSGVSRWGYDSIIQTYDQLRRGAPTLLGGIPSLLEPEFGEEIKIKWDKLVNNSDTGWNQFSLIINDIEQYRGQATEFSLTEWIKSIAPLTPARYYIRLAYARGGKTGDFTHAGIVDTIQRNWTAPKPGAA